MKIFADLHLHSHYSRATSNEMNIENLEKNAKIKGLNLLGTGDFTHPLWLKELKRNLTETENKSLFHFKDKDVYFMLQAEVSNIYNQNEKTRKIHNVILSPSFEIVEQINDFLKKYGSLSGDGRPILTNINCAELAENLINISKEIMIIPAHAWTPWFSVFGSKSGFDSIEECFQDQTKNIFALETGLSSNPAMNWRLSALDRFALVSNSDSHSPWPTRLGREANVFDAEMNYKEIINAIKEKDTKKFLYTIEVDPAYGKYHYSGHRNCGISLDPKETNKIKGICPVCVKGDTIILGDNKPISQISVNDRCIGISGYGKVKEIFKRYYKGSMFKIKACGLLPIEITPEHPMLVITSRTKNGFISSFSEPCWKESKDVVPKHGHKDGDYLMVPRINGILDINEIDLHQFTNIHGAKIVKGKGLPLSFPINKETTWLLGIYVAEGSSEAEYFEDASPNGAIRFSFGKYESKLYNRVCEIIKSIGYSPCIRKKESVTEVVVASMILKRAFSMWCGQGAINKRIPDFILLHKDLQLLKSFLDGYMKGDGCVYKNITQAETVSKMLALQLQLLYARLGILLNICYKKPRKDLFQGRKVNRHESYALFYSTKSQARTFDKFIAVPIRKADNVPYEGEVHNLETDDNTYLVSNALVHNCGKPLTIGVLHRVEELADRPEGFVPKNAVPFKSLLPLSELLAAIYNTQIFSKKVWEESTKLVKEFGSELNILLEAPEDKLRLLTHEKIAKIIIKNRKGELKVQPGYDGVYGRLLLNESTSIKQPQKRLDSFANNK